MPLAGSLQNPVQLANGVISILEPPLHGSDSTTPLAFNRPAARILTKPVWPRLFEA